MLIDKNKVEVASKQLAITTLTDYDGLRSSETEDLSVAELNAKYKTLFGEDVTNALEIMWGAYLDHAMRREKQFTENAERLAVGLQAEYIRHRIKTSDFFNSDKYKQDKYIDLVDVALFCHGYNAHAKMFCDKYSCLTLTAAAVKKRLAAKKAQQKDTDHTQSA